MASYASILKVRDHLYTKGKEYSLDGVEYIGYYHLSAGNKAYTGEVQVSTSKVLLKYYHDKDKFIFDTNTKFVFSNLLFNFNEKILFNDTDYKNKIVNRYFVYKITDVAEPLIEISKKSFDNFDKKNIVYNAISTQWKISGTADEIRIFNGKAVSNLVYIIPNIYSLVGNLFKYARISQ